MEKIRELDPIQQARVMGVSNWKLVESKVVAFRDVVTEGRIRDLREVVSRNKLTVAELRNAGIDKAAAEHAYASVHTAAHDLAAESRKKLFETLRLKGMTDAEARRAVGERLAGRLTIRRPPPSPPPSPLPPPAPLTPPQLAKAVGVTLKPAAAVPGAPVLPGRPIAERIAAYAEGDRKAAAVAAIGDAVSVAARGLAAAKAEIARLQAELDAAARTGVGYHAMPPAWRAGADRAAAEAVRARDALEAARGVAADRAVKIIELPPSARVTFRATPLDGLLRVGPSDPNIIDRAREVLGKVRRVVASQGAGQELDVRWQGVSPASRNARDFHAGAVGVSGERFSTVNLTAKTKPKTIAHELGHVVEWQVPGVNARVREFLDYRCGGEVPRKLADLFPGRGFGPTEFGRRDRFDLFFDDEAAYYAGKVYAHENSEVLSMGFEALFSDPAGFAARDPDFFKFVCGILDGSLR